MMIQAMLGNPHHPEYGVATIPFPIPHDQYAHCMELLEALEIGDAVKADLHVYQSPRNAGECNSRPVCRIAIDVFLFSAHNLV